VPSPSQPALPAPPAGVRSVYGPAFPDGLSWLLAMRDGRAELPPIAQVLGFEVREAVPGGVTFAMHPAALLYNPMGAVHGGVTATLLDTVMGCALHTRLPGDAGYSTLDISVRYIRAITERTGAVLATATLIHLGRRTAVAEARLVSERDQQLFATGNATLFLYQP
jgi:uncharacterized protein (TIGR00369 family)